MDQAEKSSNNKSYKIAILGKKDIVLNFKNFGLEAFSVSSIDEAREALKKIEKNNFAILFIEAEWGGRLKNEISILREKMLPAILLLPSHLKSEDDGSLYLKEMIRRAIGKEIFFNK